MVIRSRPNSSDSGNRTASASMHSMRLRIMPSGLLISCAMPLATLPNDASRSAAQTLHVLRNFLCFPQHAEQDPD